MEEICVKAHLGYSLGPDYNIPRSVRDQPYRVESYTSLHLPFLPITS